MLFVDDGEYLRLSHDEFDDMTNALHGECNQLHAERTTKTKKAITNSDVQVFHRRKVAVKRKSDRTFVL